MVVQVIPVVDERDINIIVVVPVVSPVFRPRVNGSDPIATVLEARVSADDHEGETIDSESMFLTKVSAETIVRNAITAVAATLLPSAVIGIPSL